jgi:hypothetical protein
LSRRGLECRRVTVRELRSAVWRHAISQDGEARSSVDCIAPAGAYSLINRAGNLTLPGGPGWGAKDDDYARAEFRALLVSWLKSLGSRVIDQPGGNSLAGADGDEWYERRVAVECGFVLHPAYAVTRVKYAPRLCEAARAESVVAAGEIAEPLVVGDSIFNCPREARELCLELARRLGLDTLRIVITRSSAEWRFLGCERLPELGGEALEALADLAAARAA